MSLFYFTSYVLNMFQTSIYPSSGASDYPVELPHWSYCSWYDVCWSFSVVGLEWYPCCASACNTDTTPTQPHWNSNTHRTKNNTTNVVIQQDSRKLLMMDRLMSETCSAHKKWNKIASDIKLVFYSSTIAMMHGPINIKKNCLSVSSCLFTLNSFITLTLNVVKAWGQKLLTTTHYQSYQCMLFSKPNYPTQTKTT